MTVKVEISGSTASAKSRASRLVELAAAGFGLIVVGLLACAALVHFSDGMKSRTIKNTIHLVLSGEATRGQQADELAYSVDRAVEKALR